MTKDIKQKTKIGMAWNAFEKIAIQGVSFIISIILARLLSPHDYGTIGMLTIFLTFSNVFIESGFPRALVQKQDRTELDFSTTLIFNILVSCVLYIILFFASPAIAVFYKTPELIALQRVFFIVIILNSLTIVQSAKLQINVDFKTIAIINGISTITSGLIAILAAYKGLGPWALVIQTLSRASISVILYWIFGHWIPKTGFSKESFKKLFGFGSKLLASGLLATTMTNINNLVIGKIYNPESLGFYTRAQQFPDLTAGTLNSVLNNSTFPMMAELQNNPDELLKSFKKLIKFTTLLVFPAMTGITLLSKPIILVLLGEKWLQASDLLFWLALSYMFVPLSSLNLNLLNAIGRSDLFLKIDISKIPIIITTMAITFPISLKAVAIGNVVTAFIYFYMNTFMIGRLYNFGAIKQLLLCWKGILSTFIMAIVLFFLEHYINNVILCLILGIITGVSVYFIALLLMREEEVIRVFRIFNHRKNKELI